MAKEPQSLIDRLKAGYDAAQKPITFLVMFFAVCLATLPSEFLPENVQKVSYMVMLLVLALILLEMLFEIYESTVKNKKKLNIVNSNDLYGEILDIVSNQKSVNIKYLGVAGRHGWTGILDKLLNENNPDSLIANKINFEIDIALLNPETQEKHNDIYKRFSTVGVAADTIQSYSNHIKETTKDSELRLHFYDHMPNMLGFLIDENYLFVTHAYWEELQGQLTLRAGGTDYFVYDRNDDFGGQEFIRRYQGWFQYITTNK